MLVPMGFKVAEREQFAVPIKCPKCGQVGSISWEEEAGADRRQGSMRKLILVSSGFHQRPGHNNSGDATIVCDRCGQVQPD